MEEARVFRIYDDAHGEFLIWTQRHEVRGFMEMNATEGGNGEGGGRTGKSLLRHGDV